MKVEQVGIGRSQVEYTGDKLQIVIPAKKNWFEILFLLAWLGGWAFGEVSALKALSVGEQNSAPGFFLFFWLIGWTMGGSFTAFIFLWNLTGKELIILSQGLLRIDRKAVGIGTSKQYFLAESKGFRVSTSANSLGPWSSGQWLGFGGGRISFDYGMKTIRFADGIDEAEANYLIDQMKLYNFIKT